MKCKFLVAVILLWCFGSLPAIAGSFYLHDHEAYWWYSVDNPGFSVVVPADADRYVQKRLFGQRLLEMTWKDGRVIMEVASVSRRDREAVRRSVEERFKPLVSNVTVIGNREITTSNQIPAYFYAYEAIGQDGRRSMLRSVFFSRDDDVVYLLMVLPSAEYQGDIREYWLRAVNGFEWN